MLHSSPRPNNRGLDLPQSSPTALLVVDKASPDCLMYDRDLYALRRRDSSIVAIFVRFGRVKCCHDGERSEKQSFEGRMVLYEREKYPMYGFCILDERREINHIQHLYPEDDISVHGNRLTLLSYPNSSQRLPFVQSSNEAFQKFSDFYAMPNFKDVQSGVGAPKIIELWAFTDDMIQVLMRLHSYIKDHKPYPKELISDSDRLRGSKDLSCISDSSSSTPPASPCFTSFRSPPVSPLTSPPTSPSPSTSTSPLQCAPSIRPLPSPGILPPYHHTDSESQNPSSAYRTIFQRPVQGSGDYHRRALLNQFFPTLGFTPSEPSSPRGPLMPLREQTPSATSNASTEQRSVYNRSVKQPQVFNTSSSAPSGSSSPRLHVGRIQKTESITTSPSEVFTPKDLIASLITDENTTFQDLSGKIEERDQYSFARGTFSDIHVGKLGTYRGAKIWVAIKIIRIPGFKDNDTDMVETITRRINRESRVWNALTHPNVLPFLGICRDCGPFPALVSPFCPLGDVVYYLKNNPSADRWRLVTGFTKGLSYLHNNEVIHGDLKGTNILIDDNGEPRICDFGVSRVIDCEGITTSFTGTPQFMAPELFPDCDEEDIEEDIEDSPFHPVVTKETDVYAYGLVALQILTGKDPTTRRFVVQKSQMGPKRQWYDPKFSLSNWIWGLFESCCELDPKTRPSILEVTEFIHSKMDVPNG